MCAVGYADGYPRSIGTGVPLRDVPSPSGEASDPAGDMAGWGAIDGHIVPVVGRISMDLTIVDVTHVPAGVLVANDHIELIGPAVPLDEAARRAGTIGYELLTSLGPRYSRRVVNG